MIIKQYTKGKSFQAIHEQGEPDIPSEFSCLLLGVIMFAGVFSCIIYSTSEINIVTVPFGFMIILLVYALIQAAKYEPLLQYLHIIKSKKTIEFHIRDLKGKTAKHELSFNQIQALQFWLNTSCLQETRDYLLNGKIETKKGEVYPFLFRIQYLNDRKELIVFAQLLADLLNFKWGEMIQNDPIVCNLRFHREFKPEELAHPIDVLSTIKQLESALPLEGDQGGLSELERLILDLREGQLEAPDHLLELVHTPWNPSEHSFEATLVEYTPNARVIYEKQYGFSFLASTTTLQRWDFDLKARTLTFTRDKESTKYSLQQAKQVLLVIEESSRSKKSLDFSTGAGSTLRRSSSTYTVYQGSVFMLGLPEMPSLWIGGTKEFTDFDTAYTASLAFAGTICSASGLPLAYKHT